MKTKIHMQTCKTDGRAFHLFNDLLYFISKAAVDPSGNPIDRIGLYDKKYQCYFLIYYIKNNELINNFIYDGYQNRSTWDYLSLPWKEMTDED